MIRFRLPAAVAAMLVAAGLSGPALGAAPDLAASSVGGHVAKLAEVSGVQARYYEAGEGAPLILLHGGRRTVFNSANMWARNIDGLAARFHVFAPDRLGYGMTGAPAGSTFSYAEEVAFVRDFIDTMKLGTVHIVGNSSGAAVALLFGMTHPERTGTLTLVGVGPHTPRAGISKATIMRQACDSIPDPAQSWNCWMKAMTYQGEATFGEGFFEASEYMKSVPEWKAMDARKRAAPPQGFDYWDPHLERIRNQGVPALPMLLVCGRHDRLDWAAGEKTPRLAGCLGFYDTIGARNAKVQLVVYNHAGHFPYREYPARFTNEVANFIDYWSARASAD